MTRPIVVQGHPATGDILNGMGDRAICDVGINPIGTKEQA